MPLHQSSKDNNANSIGNKALHNSATRQQVAASNGLHKKTTTTLRNNLLGHHQQQQHSANMANSIKALVV